MKTKKFYLHRPFNYFVKHKYPEYDCPSHVENLHHLPDDTSLNLNLSLKREIYNDRRELFKPLNVLVEWWVGWGNGILYRSVSVIAYISGSKLAF